MAKINLLTLHYSDNNGSALQTYATCKILRGLGHKVTVINLQNKDTIFARYKNIRNWISIPRYFNFWLFQHRYMVPMTHRMFSLDISKIPNCDYTIVGSDQTWNPDFKIVRDGTYFLNFVKDGSKKVSLASSFGKAAWEAPIEFSLSVKDWLSDFYAISVREKSGVDICMHHFQQTAVQVLDPTLALGDFSELIDMTPHIKNEIRCFLFKRGYSLDVINYIAAMEHIPVCQVNRRSRKTYRQFAYWNSSPIKWMKMIRDAKIWISDSFHGVAFAIIFKKQFVALVNDEQKLERIHSLLTLLGLEHKLVYSLDDLIKRYSEIMAPIDYGKVFSILENEQKRFINFLNKNIQ